MKRKKRSIVCDLQQITTLSRAFCVMRLIVLFDPFQGKGNCMGTQKVNTEQSDHAQRYEPIRSKMEEQEMAGWTLRCKRV